MKRLISVVVFATVVSVLFAVIFSLFVYIIYYVLVNQGIETVDRTEIIFQKDYKTILLYTPLYGEYSFWETYFRKILLGQCPESSCRIIANETELPIADAVLFSASDLPPRFDDDIQRKIFSQRRKDQLWIIFRMDPPSQIPNGENITQNYKDFFNLSMSYEYSSDIVSLFGEFVPRNRLQDQNPFLVGVNGQVFDVSSEEFLARKKLCVVFLRQCDNSTALRHQKFINDLKKYMEIDVFPIECNSKRDKFVTMQNYLDGNYSAFMEEKSGDYYFALALEDAICPDYSTELFFVPLQTGAVPVVMAAPTTNTRIPVDSYVNVEDFEGLEDLANHLIEVSSNRSKYFRYHRWRQDYSIKLGFPYEPMVCDLCSRLHERRKYKLLEDLNSWLSPKRCKIE